MWFLSGKIELILLHKASFTFYSVVVLLCFSEFISSLKHSCAILKKVV